MSFRTHRALVFAPLVAAAALITACDDDPVEPPDPADTVEVMRLTVGDETFNLGAGETENVTLPLGEPIEVSAVFLDGDGDEVGGLEDEFELNLVGEAGDEDDVDWARDANDPFAGTLIVDADASVAAQLFHIEEDHEDFESFLNVTVE